MQYVPVVEKHYTQAIYRNIASFVKTVAKENQEKMVFEWKELAKKYHCDFLGFDMICNRVEIDIGWENGFPECDVLNQIIKDIEKQRGES